MMGSKEKSEMQASYTNNPETIDTDCAANEKCMEGPEDRKYFLSLECAFCVYYEILRSLEPQDRLRFFKIASLLDHTIILKDLFNEDF